MHTLTRHAYVLAACLSILAGYVDAIGFLQLGGYFISFMSGNSTRLSVALMTGQTDAALMLAGLIACFVMGVILGVALHHFSTYAAPAVLSLAFVTLLLTLAALSHTLHWHMLTIAFMALAMGAENTIFMRDGEIVVGLTYMTGTLVKMGQRMAGALLGRAKFGWTPYLLLWLSLVSGGAAGALLFNFVGLKSLWVAVIWAASLTLVALLSKPPLHKTAPTAHARRAGEA